MFCQYFRTLNENLDAVWQFIKAISSKLLFTFPAQLFCQESFFCEIPSVITLGHFLKKLELLVEIFWRLTMFFAPSAKFFSMSPEEFLRKIFPIQRVLFFVKLRDEKSVLWRTFPVGLSNLLSMCLVELFLEKKPNVYLPERFESCFLRKRGIRKLFSGKECFFPIVLVIEWKPWCSLANY